MATKASDLAAILRPQIENFVKKVKPEENGRVLTIGDGIALVSGLDKAMLGELLIFNENLYGMVLNLEEEAVGVALMGKTINVKEGDLVKRTRQIISTGVGDNLLGRVINGLGEPIDEKGPLKLKEKRQIFTIAPGVMTRAEVNEPIETGILAIDALIPIGKGQRELIIGDRQIGKTALAIDTIINQRNKNVYCVYVAIGQKNSTIAQIVKKLERFKALKYTTVVDASASENAPLQYIAPYVGITIAEAWRQKGKDVLIIYDDLSKHAIAYRTLSLLLRRPPGREAYPGDVFYLHSQLLERAVKINPKHGGGSITALPIIETQANDISAYIPTNVISITDGQIFVMTNLFNLGQRPAIDIGYSVSRVGSNAQIKAIKQVVGSLKLELAQYSEMLDFAQFGSDLDVNTKKILNHGKKVLEIMKQPQYSPIEQIDQVILLMAIKERFTNPIPFEQIKVYKSQLINHFHQDDHAKKLHYQLNIKKEFDDKFYDQFKLEIYNFTLIFIKTIDNYKKDDNDPMPNMKESLEKNAINPRNKKKN